MRSELGILLKLVINFSSRKYKKSSDSSISSQVSHNVCNRDTCSLRSASASGRSDWILACSSSSSWHLSSNCCCQIFLNAVLMLGYESISISFLLVSLLSEFITYYLNQSEIGDLIVIRSTGAYGEVMSSNYNLRKKVKAYYSNELF